MLCFPGGFIVTARTSTPLVLILVSMSTVLGGMQARRAAQASPSRLMLLSATSRRCGCPLLASFAALSPVSSHVTIIVFSASVRSPCPLCFDCLSYPVLEAIYPFLSLTQWFLSCAFVRYRVRDDAVS